MSERYAALRGASDSLDFFGNQQPKCPHCGGETDIGANDLWCIYEEGEHEIDCPSCDEPFTVSVRVSFSFDTDSEGA